jgi:hypothetical protein
MAQLSPQKRKKRRVQLREAQRRRRARLKEESKSFLQIILSQEILSALRNYSGLVGKPLHSCAAELIEAGLGMHQVQGKQKEELQRPTHSEDILQCDGEAAEKTGQAASPEGSASSAAKSTGQMDLFAG